MVAFVTPPVNSKSKVVSLYKAEKPTIRKKLLKTLLPKATVAVAKAITMVEVDRVAPRNISIQVKYDGSKRRSDSGKNSSGEGTPPPKKGRKHYYDPSNNPDSYRPYDKRDINNLKFRSGLNANPLYYETLRSGDSSWSPIFIQNGTFLSKRTLDLSDEKVLDFFDTYYNRIFNEICIIKGVNTARSLDKDSLISYLMDVKCALEAVFTLRSILTYQENNPEYLNYGVQKIQERFSPNIRGALTDLEAALEVHFFPPNFLEFLKYIYSNFRSSDCERSPIIRLSYERLLYKSKDLCLDGSIESDILNQLKENLTNPKTDWQGLPFKGVSYLRDRKTTRGILTSCFPSRIITRTDFNVSGVAIYDPTFLCFWHNSGLTFIDPFSSNGSSKVIHSREVQTKGENIRYEVVCSKTELDGYALGMQNINFKGVFGPGIWNPLTEFGNIDTIDNHTNLLRMDGNDLVANMPVILASQSGIQYQPVIDGDTITIGTFPTSGTMILEGLNVYTSEEYSTSLLDYLMK